MTDLNVMQPIRLGNSAKATAFQNVTSGDTLLGSNSGLSHSNGLDKNLNLERKANEVTSTSENRTDVEDLQAIDNKDIDRLAEEINVQLEQINSYLRFEKDEDSERMVIFIKDSGTDEVIRQIPSQEFLRISKNITNFLEMRQQSLESTAPPVGLITDLEV